MKYKTRKLKITPPVFPLYQQWVKLPEPKPEIIYKCYPMTKLIGIFSFVFVLVLFMV